MDSTNRALRSSARKAEKENEAISNIRELPELPFIEYKGRVRYYTTFVDCAYVCDNLLTVVQNAKDVFVMGFDMEWPFSYKAGSGKTALIQLSPSLEECHLFHIGLLRSLPKALVELFSHPNVRLAGVNIRCDIHKLCRDFTSIKAESILNNCIDLRTQAKQIVSDGRCWSMKKLVNFFFNQEINKDKKVRQSKWNVIPLSKDQRYYAAIDAYVSLKLYLHLKEMELVKQMQASI